MKYKTYKMFLSIFLFLLMLILYLNIIEIEVDWIVRIDGLIIYSFSALSLIFLYFSIYAYLQKVNTVKKIESPIVFIVIASIITFISFVYPISDYFIARRMIDNSQMKAMLHLYSDTICQNSSLEHSKRLFAAKYYYINTGKCVEYLDENQSKVIFSPNYMNKKERIKYEQMRSNIEKTFHSTKNKAFNILTYAVISFIGFLLFISYKRKHAKEPERP